MKAALARVVVATPLAVLIGCGDDDGGSDDTPPPATCEVTPGTWSAPNWRANTAEALALRAQLDTLAGGPTMRAAEQGTLTISDPATLVALYESGSPSLASVTTPFYDAVVRESFDELVALLAAGPGDPIDDAGQWTPGPSGGVYGASTRGIDAGGLEVRQLVDKGLFAGGALYAYALARTTAPIDEATIDSLAAAWGANETLDPAGDLTDSANYSFQMGFHEEIATSLVAAKAFAADATCTAERNGALRSFFRTWEQSMLARLVFYANEAAAAVAGATADEDEIEALHELAEGIGLALGFRSVPGPTSGPLAGGIPTITDGALDEIAAALGVDLEDLNASTTGLFVEDPAAFAAAVTEVEDVVADTYGLDAATLASYRAPTEG